ncbi:hypothetical protein [Nocardia puris]|uniref:Uncharacterized protein n=1 Tax=Nocardia puris TaxID=208602 RepID=A0A366CWQ9_9NOCA|nr:hypothetical protein [Nocardia puris]RBO82055.1 hypothetical protein DFR74_12510 [Nocardia puris]
MITYVYPRFQLSALSGEVNLATDDLRMVLLTSSYTPDLDAHQHYDDLSGELTTADGYTAGGQALTGVSLAYDSATDTVWLDANTVVWDPSSLTARYAALVDAETGVAATSPLILLWDFEENKTSDNSEFRLDVHATGLLRVVANPA